MLFDKMSVGRRFQKYRIDRGMSQLSVSEGICSPTMVSLLENDKTIPSPKILGKLAERLGVPLREIMGKDEEGLGADFQLDLLRVYMEAGEYQHALAVVDKLQGLHSLLEHQQQSLLLARAECLVKVSQFREAVDLLLPFVEDQDVQQQIEDDVLCNAYNMLGIAYDRLNDFEKAYSAFERGYRISLKLPAFDLVAARVTKNFGLTCNQLGLHEDAKRYLNKAGIFYEKIVDTKSLADTYFSIAIATSSEEYVAKALELYTSLNLIKEAYHVRQYHAFHIQSKKDSKHALDTLLKIAKGQSEINDLSGYVFTIGRAVRVCLHRGKHEEAQRFIQQGNEKLSQVEDDGVVADFYQAIAQYHLLLEDFSESITFAQKSCDLFSIMGIRTDYADSLELMAESYMRMGLFEKAYSLQKEVVDNLRRVGRRSV